MNTQCMASASWNIFLFMWISYVSYMAGTFITHPNVFQFLTSLTLKCILNCDRSLFRGLCSWTGMLFFVEWNPLGWTPTNTAACFLFLGWYIQRGPHSALFEFPLTLSLTNKDASHGWTSYFCDMFSIRNIASECLCMSKGMCVVMRCHTSVEEWRWACHHWFPVFTFLKALCVYCTK